MQDFNISSNTSVLVGESSINSYNVTVVAVIENLMKQIWHIQVVARSR